MAILCRDTLQGSPQKHRCEFLESLRVIVRVSPNTPVFLTGRVQAAEKVVRCFSEVVRVLVSTGLAGIKSYLQIIALGEK